MFFCDLLHVQSEFSLDSCQSWKYMKDSFFSQESCRSSADVKGAMPGLQSHTHYRFYFEYSWYQKTDPLSWTCLMYLQQHAIFYYNIVHYTTSYLRKNFYIYYNFGVKWIWSHDIFGINCKPHSWSS